MILCAFVCLSSVAVILGESTVDEGYNQGGYEAELPGGRIEEDLNPQGQISKFFGTGFEEDAEKGEEKSSPRRGVVDHEVADQLEGNGWLDVIPGIPGKDYPNYEKIPETSFTCDDKTPGGYYADIEARCQVFHVCDSGGKKSSFVCPSGSIFNQKYFVCDWWYDFECDDATDLYSLNEKVNRGGTGSGPSGPGRVEQSGEYSLDTDNFHGQELRNDGNFVSVDGFDLSLAGTGEGGPGYVRNGKSKGYQSNVKDEDEENKEDIENEGQGRRRKNFNGRKTAGGEELSRSDYSSGGNKDKENYERKNSRDEFVSPKGFSSGSSRNREHESRVLSDARASGEYVRKQNSGAGNPRVNYQGGYVSGNSNGTQKTGNFRSGNGGIHRDEQSNGFIENRNTRAEENDDNYPRRDTQRYENRRGFGQRSTAGSLAPKTVDNDYNQGSYSSGSSSGFNNGEFSNGEVEKYEERKKLHSGRVSAPVSSGSDNNEYRSSSGSGFSGPANVRPRQRTSGGLPGGLGNGYPIPAGRVRELPGSDAIGSGIARASGRAVYEKGDQGSSNSRQETSSSGRYPGEITDVEKLGFNSRNHEQIQRSDFREDNFSSGGMDPPINRKNSNPISSSRNEKSLDSQSNHQRRQGSGNNDGNDYLVGIVPGTEDRGNGSSSSNQQRRYLPIL